jgi:polyribonucleotide 5'-hydroxyl-kinase
MSTSNSGSSNIRVLEPETEYRFELDPGSSLAIRVRPRSRPITGMMIDRKIYLQVLKGHAEVFGAELADGKYYLFGRECKAAIFTWQGCTIEMSPLLRITDRTNSSSTSQEHRPQTMSLMRRPCTHTRMSISPSKRCAYAL